MTATTSRSSAVSSPVLLVLTGGTVSQAAICRTAELRGGGTGHRDRHGWYRATQQVRRAVALAMSALEDAGVAALGHVTVTGSPCSAVARVARARGARVVVLDREPAGPPLPGRPLPGRPGIAGRPGGLAAELRRRMYGSGVIVVAPDELGGTRGRR